MRKVKANPKSDWKIKDLETICQQIGMNCTPPRGGGSHYRVSSPLAMGVLTIPAARPIKVVYIRQFIAFANVHLSKLAEDKSYD